MSNQNAEQKARDQIDELLRRSGWVVQDYASMNLASGAAIAVREFGKADYLLYLNRSVVGVVEFGAVLPRLIKELNKVLAA